MNSYLINCTKSRRLELWYFHFPRKSVIYIFSSLLIDFFEKMSKPWIIWLKIANRCLCKGEARPTKSDSAWPSQKHWLIRRPQSYIGVFSQIFVCFWHCLKQSVFFMTKLCKKLTSWETKNITTPILLY